MISEVSLDDQFTDGSLTHQTRQSKSVRSPLLQSLIIYGSVVLFSLFFLLFLFIVTRLGAPSSSDVRAIEPSRLTSDVRNMFRKELNPQQCDRNLQILTREPSLSGTEGARKLATFLRDEFISYGLHNVHLESYDVFMTYPTNDNVLQIVTDDNQVTFTADLYEKPIQEDDTSNIDKNLVPPFLAYTANGYIDKAKLVYANYGSKEDYEYLVDQLHMDLTGTIILARYGRVFRGIKVFLAEKYGAAGVIIYSDPANDGDAIGKIYPEGPGRPDTAIQRGSSLFLNLMPGDPATPYQPSYNSTHRLDRDQMKNLPKIPVIPISYKNAKMLLESLRGEVAPDAWKGGISGITYRIGDLSNNRTNIRLGVSVKEETRPIYNVIASIPGKEEPDRTVILGGHYDSWIYGGVDPHTGVISYLEVARSLGKLLKTGWRPRRTIIIAAWDAEEQGLIGSTEFCESHAAKLSREAVVYVNVDSYTGFDSFDPNASPYVATTIIEESKKVDVTVDDVQMSLFEFWKRTSKGGKPKVTYLGSGSDYTAFLQHLGIPAANLDSNGPYGVYHSIFDSYHYVKTITDPTFSTCKTIAEILGLVALRFASDRVLPYSASNYMSVLDSELVKLASEDQQLKQYRAKLNPNDKILLSTALFTLSNNIQQTKQAIADGVEREITLMGFINNEQKLRSLNDRLMSLERCFIDSRGLTDRNWYRHLVFAPGYYLGYGEEVFPGVRHAIREGTFEQVISEIDRLNIALRCILDNVGQPA